MNTTDRDSPLPDPTSPGKRFDDAMRSHHAEAVASVSARTQAQLHNRMRAALAAPATARSHRPAWGLAAACSLALVAAVALQVRAPDVATPTPVAVEATADNGDLLASLDEAPDLYLWLASDDASALVSE